MYWEMTCLLSCMEGILLILHLNHHNHHNQATNLSKPRTHAAQAQTWDRNETIEWISLIAVQKFSQDSTFHHVLLTNDIIAILLSILHQRTARILHTATAPQGGDIQSTNSTTNQGDKDQKDEHQAVGSEEELLYLEYCVALLMNLSLGRNGRNKIFEYSYETQAQQEDLPANGQQADFPKDFNVVEMLLNLSSPRFLSYIANIRQRSRHTQCKTSSSKSLLNSNSFPNLLPSHSAKSLANDALPPANFTQENAASEAEYDQSEDVIITYSNGILYSIINFQEFQVYAERIGMKETLIQRIEDTDQLYSDRIRKQYQCLLQRLQEHPQTIHHDRDAPQDNHLQRADQHEDHATDDPPDDEGEEEEEEEEEEEDDAMEIILETDEDEDPVLRANSKSIPAPTHLLSLPQPLRLSTSPIHRPSPTTQHSPVSLSVNPIAIQRSKGEKAGEPLLRELYELYHGAHAKPRGNTNTDPRPGGLHLHTQDTVEAKEDSKDSRDSGDQGNALATPTAPNQADQEAQSDQSEHIQPSGRNAVTPDELKSRPKIPRTPLNSGRRRSRGGPTSSSQLPARQVSFATLKKQERTKKQLADPEYKKGFQTREKVRT